MDSHGWPWASPRNQEPGAFLLRAVGSYWGHLLSRALVGLWSRAWLKGASWRTCPREQRTASCSPNQSMPHGDVWYPGTICLEKAGSSPPHLLHPIWPQELDTISSNSSCSCLVSLPTVLTSSETVIPLTRRIMTPMHYFKCLFFFFVKELISLLWYWITF